jgi:hypothetical protein
LEVDEVAAVDEHQVVLFFLQERESVQVTVTRRLVFLLNFEVYFWEVVSIKFLYLLLSYHHLYFQMQNWQIIQLSLQMVSMMFREKSQMLLSLLFAFDEFPQVRYWVFERNFSILLGHLQIVEMRKHWRVKQRAIVKSPYELQ